MSLYAMTKRSPNTNNLLKQYKAAHKAEGELWAAAKRSPAALMNPRTLELIRTAQQTRAGIRRVFNIPGDVNSEVEFDRSLGLSVL